MLHLSRDSKG